MFSKRNLQKYLDKGFLCEKHPEHDLYIYGYYSNKSIIWDSINVHLRGLIATEDGQIVSRSFKKFFGFKQYLSKNTVLLSDNQIAPIPVGKCRIYEKIDGCLVMLYWIGHTPYLATQRSFCSWKANRATEILHKKYSHTFNKFDRNCTYIFEAVFPEIRVIIDYGIEDLFLIGIIETSSGLDMPLQDIGFKMPFDYSNDLEFMEDIKGLQNLNLPEKEGFVLVYPNGLRLKVKFPWYQNVHSLMNKIIQMQNDLYWEIRKFKVIMNINDNLLSVSKVHDHLNEGKHIDMLYKFIPDAHYYVGIQHWLNNVVNEYNLQKKHLDDGVYTTETNTTNIESVFIPAELSESIKDSKMWNFIDRIEKTFD